MSRRFKVSRNDSCPCGSGKKYKHCCEGVVDWAQIIRNGEDQKKYLSVRGRNMLFISKIAEALGFDSKTAPDSLKEYKAAFTSKAVRKIHESIIEIWPPSIRINSVLQSMSGGVTGLYIGDYRTENILKGIIRHSIYANKLIIVDPFIYPLSVRDEYNPIANPDQYRTQTLKNVNFWLELLPWIEEGIVEVIRTPDDFDKKLKWDSLNQQKKKFEENQELREALKESVKELKKQYREEDIFRDLVLSAPNSYLERVFKELNLERSGISISQFISYIEKVRKSDPYFLEPLGLGRKEKQLHIYTTGTSYDTALMTARLTGSYLLTDIYSKWKEIEIDRKTHDVANAEWAPFAKAFQNLEIKYLNNLKLHHALALRREHRLDSLRVFLRKVWKSACTGAPFSETNAKLLADELKEEIRQAEEEWKQIDRNLLKWFGAELGTFLLSAGPLIASGYAIFLAAAFVASGTSTLISARGQRKSFQDKFPAGFFMRLKK